MSDSNAQPIIVIKKKGSHGGHHGGAWKVAYADFVTAMMALFIVLWLMSSNADVKEAVGAYFNDPTGSGKERGSSLVGTGESLSVNKDDMGNLKERLEQALKQSPDFEKLKNNVQMSVTVDGLRVEMLESETGMFFQSGSPAPSSTGKELIVKLAQELGQLPNDLLIEGHTDAKPFGAKTDYTNWELSSDRANAARRLMEASGLRQGQVVQVRGFADQALRLPNHPNAAQNRRISVIVKYKNRPLSAAGEPSPASAAGEPSKDEHAGEAKPSEHGASPSSGPAQAAEHH